MSYQNSETAKEMTAQAIFGGIKLSGKLPVSTRHYPLNAGLKTNKIRLKYTMPEEFGVNTSDLYKIDSLANNAISEKATPGCQILIAKEGKIIFINSVAGKYGYPYSAAYVSSKFGLRGLADSLRNELREHNIKVISIHPGAINTNFWDNIKGDFPKDQMLTSECIATFVLQAIISPDNAVVEEMVIRRTAGDM